MLELITLIMNQAINILVIINGKKSNIQENIQENRVNYAN